ncbi:MAG: hypothetical protein KBD64_07755 [Gammaproteobacteria bacterium]|nr:hypothetical protein [Gammaproteobacteria bacterium]
MDTDRESTAGNNKLVVYYWTNLVAKQPGSKLEQQRSDFARWLASDSQAQSHALEVMGEFIDIHLKRTKPKHFPELIKAIESALTNHAKLVIVKLNGLISQEAFYNLLCTEHLDFVCVDKQLVTPSALSVVRQYVTQQSKQHSASIKRGLKLTNRKLGNPNAANAISPFNKIKTENSVLFALILQPVIAEYQKKGLSQRKMVDMLNQSKILAPEGGKWVLSQLQKVLKRIAANNLAIDVGKEIEEKHYHHYSAHDLMAALNQSHYQPSSHANMGLWDEDQLTTAKTRTDTITSVLELYEFMQKWGEQVNNYVTEGLDLQGIANKLNNNKLQVPHVLVDVASPSHSQQKWDVKLVEELLRRLDNRLHLVYDPSAKETLLQALAAYNNSADAFTGSFYNNPVLKNMVNEIGEGRS